MINNLFLIISGSTSVRVFLDFSVTIVGTVQFANQTTLILAKTVELAGKFYVNSKIHPRTVL